jgi:hypothetical protein
MLANNDNFGGYNGISAIDYLLKSLKMYKSLNLPQEAIEFLDKSHLMLSGMSGPVLSRRLYGSFLQWAINQNKVLLDIRATELCRSLSSNWNVLSAVLYKISKGKSLLALERAIDRLTDILNQERELAEILCGAVEFQ